MNRQPLTLTDTDFRFDGEGYRLTQEGYRKVNAQKQNDLYRYAYGMVGDWADDIVQNVWIKALNQSFKSASASVVMVWLFKVAHNESLDWIAKSKRSTATEQMPETAVAPEADRFETRQRIDQLLSGLSESERNCLTWHTQGYSYREIAERLSVSEENVGVMIHRAKKKIVLN